MKTNKEKLYLLIKTHKYLILKDYSGFNTKIELQCKTCTHRRTVLPKSFIKNPECKQCIKINKISSEEKEKITTLNINIRRKAKKIGFKINEWFEESPNKVTVYCRDCNKSYTRSVSSLRNGLTCFNCKNNNNKQKPFKLDSSDIPFFVDFIKKKKSIKTLNNNEKIIVKKIKNILKIESVKDIERVDDYFLIDKIYKLKIITNKYSKKYLLGNVFKDIYDTNPFLNKQFGIKKNTTLQELDTSFNLKILYKKLLSEYVNIINNIEGEEVSIFFKKLISQDILIKIKTTSSDISITHHNFSKIKEPSTINCEIIDDKVHIFFNNGINFCLKLQAAQNKDFFSSWDNLIQENWILLS